MTDRKVRRGAAHAVFRKDGLLAFLVALKSLRRRGGAASWAAVATVVAAAGLTPNSTESAVANGDTRTVVFSDRHTGESGSFTYMVNGVYDPAVLDKLNWFMRDWRIDQPTKMDPRLFDIIWEVYRESGSTQPIDVLSGYRSPQTNAMLRRRSSLVARYSEHMLGKAIDAHFVDVSTARIRDIAMRMEEGGVGFYPTGATPWVHIDSGSVRYWPRMSRTALARLFPDGKTVFIPADGKPMPGYELAKAEVESRGGAVQTASGGGGGILAWLFGARGGGEDDAEENGGQLTLVGARGPRVEQRVRIADAGPAAVEKAKQGLPTGPTYASAPPAAPAASPQAAPAPKQSAPEQQAVASADSPVKLSGPIAARFLAPLPPRRPGDLEQDVAALANVPLPPARPADVVAAATTANPAVAQSPRSIRGLDLIAGLLRRSRLPRVITEGVDRAPTGALALAEVPTARNYDDDALLARASELSAPLPPMPIPVAGLPERAAGLASRTSEDSEAKRSAGLSGPDIARLFGKLPFDAFKFSGPPASSSDGLRGSQQ